MKEKNIYEKYINYNNGLLLSFSNDSYSYLFQDDAIEEEKDFKNIDIDENIINNFNTWKQYIKQTYKKNINYILYLFDLPYKNLILREAFYYELFLDEYNKFTDISKDKNVLNFIIKLIISD